MKKTLVSALTTALVIGAASTTFAAANPFEDVPADHWAYDAIAQLAADGVIEGYGDGTYRGDQEITRYEMAQMVARAMAKGGGDKALIDKLAAEFADELNNLGVRVANLEKKVDNVKWPGQITYVYKTTRWEHNGDDNGSNAAEREGHSGHMNHQFVRLRLEPEMQINKNWSGHARIDYKSSMNSAKNVVGGGTQIEEDGGNDFQVERMWVQGDYNNFQILLGKLPYLSNIDGGMLFDDNVSGGQLTIGSNIKGTVTVGRTRNTPDGDKTGNYVGVELYNDRESKFTWGIGYHRIHNKEAYNAALGDGKDASSIWEAGLGFQITDTLNLNGAYAWNTAVETERTGPNSKHAWTVELDYKGADEKDKGSWGAYAAYRKLGYNAVIVPTYDAMEPGWKGWEVGFDYVPMKNFMASFRYFRGDMMRAWHDDEDTSAQRFYTELNFFF